MSVTMSLTNHPLGLRLLERCGEEEGRRATEARRGLTKWCNDMRGGVQRRIGEDAMEARRAELELGEVS